MAFSNYIKGISSWLLRGKYHVFSILASAITVLYLTKLLAFYPNTIAVILSLTGLAIILTQQMIDARQFAEHKPNTFLNWIRSFPRTGRKVMAAGKIELTSATMKAHATVSIASDASLERKVEFLLRQLTALDTAIVKVDRKVDEIELSIKAVRGDINNKVREISTSLNTVIAGHAVGAYDISLFGITITVCGTLIQFFST